MAMPYPSNKTCRPGEHQVRLLVIYPHRLLSKTFLLGERTINNLILIRRYCMKDNIDIVLTPEVSKYIDDL